MESEIGTRLDPLRWIRERACGVYRSSVVVGGACVVFALFCPFVLYTVARPAEAQEMTRYEWIK